MLENTLSLTKEKFVFATAAIVPVICVAEFVNDPVIDPPVIETFADRNASALRLVIMLSPVPNPVIDPAPTRIYALPVCARMFPETVRADAFILSRCTPAVEIFSSGTVLSEV